MRIEARYSSQCPQCLRHIRPGEIVEWMRGEPAYHIACAKAERAAFAALDRTRRPRREEVEEDEAETRWQEDRHILGTPGPRGEDLRLTLNWD